MVNNNSADTSWAWLRFASSPDQLHMLLILFRSQNLKHVIVTTGVRNANPPVQKHAKFCWVTFSNVPLWSKQVLTARPKSISRVVYASPQEMDMRERVNNCAQMIWSTRSWRIHNNKIINIVCICLNKALYKHSAIQRYYLNPSYDCYVFSTLIIFFCEPSLCTNLRSLYLILLDQERPINLNHHIRNIFQYL